VSDSTSHDDVLQQLVLRVTDLAALCNRLATVVHYVQLKSDSNTEILQIVTNVVTEISERQDEEIRTLLRANLSGVDAVLRSTTDELRKIRREIHDARS
jgi:hypothetical protein